MRLCLHAASVLVLLSSTAAHAAPFKTTEGGHAVRFHERSVAFEVDASVTRAGEDVEGMVREAVFEWSSFVPTRRLSLATSGDFSDPKVDYKNRISVSTSYPGLGRALAVTIVTTNEKTGDILDADIVINGRYQFARLPSVESVPEGLSPVATDGAAGSDAANHAFDLSHVMVHELGHAFGLRDQPEDTTSVMYAYTYPGVAVPLTPSDADREALDTLYPEERLVAPRACAMSSRSSEDDALRWAPLLALCAHLGRKKRLKFSERKPFPHR